MENRRRPGNTPLVSLATMTQTEPGTSMIRHRRLVVALLAITATIAVPLVDKFLAPPATTSASSGHVIVGEGNGALGVAGGAVPDGTTVFDDSVPAVVRLDPALLGALRRAATDAHRSGVTFYVDSGWRSAAYQEHLLRQAIAEYGSEHAAARWVATPTTSAHVTGDAVDIGHSDATGWLSRHGAAYGLCQIYRNESWHYELRPAAAQQGCPALYADPTHDPRMEPR
jgi:hypothetical protein